MIVKLNGDSPHPPGFGLATGSATVGTVPRKNLLILKVTPLLWKVLLDVTVTLYSPSRLDADVCIVHVPVVSAMQDAVTPVLSIVKFTAESVILEARQSSYAVAMKVITEPRV